MNKIRGKILMCVLILTFSYLAVYCAVMNRTLAVDLSRENKTILIDPGHGGMDGGAVSSSGTKEKDITLKISKKLKNVLEKKGYTVVMTREEDKGLYDNENTVRQKKLADLRARTNMKTSSNCDIFISIHLNKFEQSQYYGAEVYYSNREDSKMLADSIMKEFKTGIDDGNKRGIKPAQDMFKILREQDNMPGIIIECGFLSNPREEELLKSDAYQDKLVGLMKNGIEEFIKK